MLVRAEDNLVDFKCGVTDLMCKSVEQGGKWTAEAINWLTKTSLGGETFRPGGSLWYASQEQAGKWLGMAIIVMFITFVVGISGGALLQRPDTIKRTIFATLCSLPAFYFSYYIVAQGLAVIDEFTDGLIGRLTSEEGFAGMIEKLFSGQADWGASVIGAVVGAPPVGQMMLVLGIMGLGMLVIMFAMSFRDFVIMVLITFGPLAFVLFPAKGLTDEWTKRWISAITAMALARPLILGTLLLLMNGFGKIDSIWSGEGLTLAIGVFITGFMPVLAYGFFQFMGGGTGGDDVGRGAGASGAQKVRSMTSFISRRLPNGPSGQRSPAGNNTPQKTGPSTNRSTSVTEKSNEKPQPKSSNGPDRPGAGPGSSGRFSQQDPSPQGGRGQQRGNVSPPQSQPKPAPTPPRSQSPSPQVPRGPRR